MLRHLAKPERKGGMEKVKRTSDNIGLTEFEPDEELPRGYMSASQVLMYLRCARQYEFRYIENTVIPPAVALIEGGCHHDALEEDNNNKFENGESLPTIDVIDHFSDSFSDKCIEIPKNEWIFSGETKDSVIKRGHGLIKIYMKDHSHLIMPSVEPEQKIEMMFGGVPFLGYIDVETKQSVVDYKVVKQAKNQNAVDNDLQLTIYSKARKKKNVEFCCLVKTKTPKIINIGATRNENDYGVANAIVESVVDGIKAGVFPMCNPTDVFPCSKKWCGYFTRCRMGY